MTELVKANEAFRDVIVGNEPNLNRFWLPQFRANGTGASAPAYNSAARHDLRRGQGGRARDRRLGRRAGAARRRQAAHGPRHDLADALHPRVGRGLPRQPAHACRSWTASPSTRTARTRASPSTALPGDRDHLGLIDQDRLVRLLGSAFDGTAQKGSGLPILYDEYGIESVIPAEKAGLYSGSEPTTTRPGLGDRRRRPRTRRRSGSRTASRTSPACCSSTRPTSRPAPAGSRGSSTPTARRRRRSASCATRWTRSRAGRSASARSRSSPWSRSCRATVRSRSDATATASTAPAWSGFRPDR